MHTTSTHPHYYLKRLSVGLVLFLLILVGRSASSVQAATPGLRMQGVTLVNTDGARFIVSGINMEMYRDYANGCEWVTDGQYAIRGAMADRIKALGVNAVRLNYAYRFLTSSNLTKFLDMAQELANRGMYVMPSDHTYTGGVLSGASASYPMMKSIVDGMRARGLENYLVMNPYNEPGPNISVAQWVQAQKDVLTYLRKTALFNGVVVMDGTGWATLLDVNAFQQVMSFDASLRGSTANVIFSMHLYPNIPSLPNQLWSAANQVPLTIGELGQENPGSSPLDPQYVKNVISGALNTGIPNGHNGLFAWIWAWCDSNAMLQDWSDSSAAYTANSPLTSHGVLWRDFYYSKVPSSGPVPTTIVQQPTATRTNTPRPATAVPTNTPRPATNTVAPPPGVTLSPPSSTNTPRPATNTVVPPPSTATGDRSFYRAINFGGTAVTIGSQTWEASASAPNLSIKSGSYQDCNIYAPIAPAVDASTEKMLECYVEHWSHGLTLSAVPNAAYDVYVYTWQDWNQPSPGTVNFSVNGAVTQAIYAISSTAGRWERLGPWRVNVTAGSLALTTSGANIKLSGLEVWRVNSGVPATAQPTTIVQQPTATKTNTIVPPTATRTTVPATATRTTIPATATRTTTVVPATMTRTSPPATVTQTMTAVPATATKTATPRPATVTPTRTGIPATATKTATPTGTALLPTVPPPPTDSTFYRAINFGGNAVTIANHLWEASTGAPNFSIRAGTHTECNPYVTLIPATDKATEQMIECFAEHWSHQITLSAVPSASYDVYVYAWQDWNQPTPGKVTFQLNDATAQANYAITSQQGKWEKLGPWRVAVTAGNLKLTTSGSNIKLSGMEVYRVGASSSGVVMVPTSDPASRSAAPATPIPTGFYRGLNLNGNALVIDGQAWDGDDAADVTVSGTKACSTDTVFMPATDSSHTDMLRCYATGPALKVVVRNVPAGTYDVYAYLWDMPERYTLSLQGGQATWFNQPNPASSWLKVGAWTVTVDASGLLVLETTSGIAKLAGLELWRVDAPTSVDDSQPEVAPTFVPNAQGGQAGTSSTSSQLQALTQVVESDDARLSRTGNWQAQATGKASGGSYLFASNAQIGFTFIGTQFDVLYVQHTALGSFVIEVDGVVVQTVDSRSEQTKFQSVASVRELAAGQHIVVIRAAEGAAAIDAVVLETNASVS